jgi:PAS domain S-box-containing protein
MADSRRLIAGVTLGYMVAAGGWIVFSDQMLGRILDAETITALSMAKGLSFVAITTCLLFVALRSVASSSGPVPLTAPGKPWALGLVFSALVVMVGGIGALAFRVQSAAIETNAQRELGAVVRLESDAVGRWLAERRANVVAAAAEPELRILLAGLLAKNDDSTRQRVSGMLGNLRSSYGFSSVEILDPRGVLWVGDGPVETLSPEVERAVAAAVDRRETTFLDLYHPGSGDANHMAFIAPVMMAGAEGPVIAMVLCVMRAEDYLFPFIKAWPLPGTSGETLLVRKDKANDKDHIVFLNDLRYQSGTALSLRIPADFPDLLATKAFVDDGVASSGVASSGVDYRGVPALGAARPVVGTPWMMIAKRDKDEALAEIRDLAASTAILTVGSLVVVGVILAMLWQRQRLRWLGIELLQSRALDAAERRFSVTFDSAAVGIAHVGIDGRWLRVNSRLCQILGYSPEEMQARTFQDVTPPADLVADQVALRRFLSGEIQDHRREKRYVRKDGSMIWVNLTVSMVESVDGVPDYFITVVEDISARKTAEEKVARLTSAYRTLSETNQTIVRVADRGELFSNICRVAVDFGGFRLARVVRLEGDPPGMTMVVHAGPADGLLRLPEIRDWTYGADKRRRFVGAVCDGQHFVTGDVAADPYMSPWAPLYARFGIRSFGMFPLLENGNVTHAIIFYAPDPDAFDADMVHLLDEMALDVSFGIDNLRRAGDLRDALAALERSQSDLEQRVEIRTEELHQAKLNAEQSDRVKSAFLATMSHELRTPLNSLIGFSGVLLSGRPGPLSDERIRQLTIMQNAGRHLMALINDVLDISRIEAGEMRVECGRVDLKAVVGRVAAAFLPQAQARGLTLETEIAGDASLVIADERRLEQVLNNLVANALKFSERGAIVLSCLLRRGRVEISVADSGIGIAAQDLSRIFLPFVQLAASPGRGVKEGTGLGLSICRRLVEAMGGGIDVHSRPGEGSTFHFTLPLASPIQAGEIAP